MECWRTVGSATSLVLLARSAWARFVSAYLHRSRRQFAGRRSGRVSPKRSDPSHNGRQFLDDHGPGFVRQQRAVIDRKPQNVESDVALLLIFHEGVPRRCREVHARDKALRPALSWTCPVFVERFGVGVSVTDVRLRRPPFGCSSLVRPPRSPFLHPGPCAGSAAAHSPCQARAFCAPVRACA